MDSKKELFLSRAKQLVLGLREEYQRIPEEYCEHFLAARNYLPTDALKLFENFLDSIILEYFDEIEIFEGGVTLQNIELNALMPLRCKLDGRYGLYFNFSICDPELIESKSIEELFICNLIGLIMKFKIQQGGFYLLLDCSGAGYKNMWFSLLVNCLSIFMDYFPLQIKAIYIFNANIFFKAFIGSMAVISNHRVALKDLISFVDEDAIADLADEIDLLPALLGGNLANNDGEMTRWSVYLVMFLKEFLEGKKNVIKSEKINDMNVTQTELKIIEERKAKFAVSESSTYLDAGTKKVHEIAQCYIDSPELIQTEFDQMKYQTPSENSYKTSKLHPDENRRDYAIEVSRVVIDYEPNDYINANFVDGVNHVKEYIVTQAPMENTLEQFLRMIWQYKVRFVLMFCHSSDSSKYWLDDENNSLSIGPFNLTKSSPSKSDGYILETTIKMTNADDPLTEFIEWAHIMPNEKAFTNKNQKFIVKPEFLSKVLTVSESDQFKPINEEPIVVHCRSGTRMSVIFVASRIIRFLMRSNKVFEFTKIVELIRTQRGNSIRTFADFKLIFVTVIKTALREKKISATQYSYLQNGLNFK